MIFLQISQKLLFNGDVLQPHRYDFLGLHLIDDLFFFDRHIVHYVLNLIVIRAASLDWHLYTLLDVLDVALLVGDVLDSSDGGECGHFWRDRDCLAASSADKLSLCFYLLRGVLIHNGRCLYLCLNGNPGLGLNIEWIDSHHSLSIDGLVLCQNTRGGHLANDGVDWDITLPIVPFLFWALLGSDRSHVVKLNIVPNNLNAGRLNR